MKTASQMELRALVAAHERKIEALLTSPVRRLGAWLRAIAAPLSFGRLGRLQTFDEYVAKVDHRVLRRATPFRHRPTPGVPLPADIPRFWRDSSVPEAIGLIDALLAAHDHRALFRLIDAPGIAARDESEIVRAYALTRLYDQQRIFSDSAASAERLLAREGVRELLGDKACLLIVGARAHALARLGGVSEALDGLGAALAQFPAAASLHRLRAEILWPTDPAAALAALETCISLGDNAAELRLLRFHLLAQNDAFDHRKAQADEERHFWELGKEPPRDFLLAFANAAGAAGDLPGQRELFDRAFAVQSLEPCIAEAWKPVAFANLGNAASPPITAGPLVSVVMTAFNAEATIVQSVRSVLDQSYRNLELLIVDDGSDDATAAIAKALADRDPRVSVLRNARNTGTYVAKNRALADARGAYFTFQDADDWGHPQRLAAHVALMEAHPQLAASRSLLIRMSESGIFSLKRWGGRIAHLNPASAFCRKRVLDEIGYFDSVRVGADSEHWFRVRHRFGPEAVTVIPLTLTIARHHDASLTRLGAGALDRGGHSPVRELYQKHWLAWHRAQSQSRDLHLPPHQTERRFPAPPDIAVGHAPEDGPAAAPLGGVRRAPVATAPAVGREIVFGISLASQRSVRDWERTTGLLRSTLRSALGQTDPGVRVLVCGHERPALAELADPRVEFLVSDGPPPADAQGFRRDKMHKRRIIGLRLRQLGGGYFVPLDADDLVSNRLADHVRSHDNRRGYSITEGYVLDWSNRRLAPVPGAWDAGFDRVCGSSAVLFLAPEDLPEENSPASEASYFELFGEHAYWPVVAEESGRKLDRIPFRGAVYVVNHAENLSFQLQRNRRRQQNLIAAIAANSIPITRDIAAEFAIPEEFMAAPVQA